MMLCKTTTRHKKTKKRSYRTNKKKIHKRKYHRHNSICEGHITDSAMYSTSVIDAMIDVMSSL